MPNKQDVLDDEQHRVIEDLARLLEPFGLPLTTGRLWGYLLLSPEPASLERISADLQISKSGASVAARQLEAGTLARRIGQRGSRRVLYEASENYDQMMVARNTLLRALSGLLETGARGTPSATVRARLQGMSDLYRMAIDEVDLILRRWREGRER